MKKRTKEKEKVEDGKRTTCRRAQSSNHRTRLKSQSSYILYLTTVEHRCTSKRNSKLNFIILSLPGTAVPLLTFLDHQRSSRYCWVGVGRCCKRCCKTTESFGCSLVGRDNPTIQVIATPTISHGCNHRFAQYDSVAT
jgi:hypothetical protein